MLGKVWCLLNGVRWSLNSLVGPSGEELQRGQDPCVGRSDRRRVLPIISTYRQTLSTAPHECRATPVLGLERAGGFVATTIRMCFVSLSIRTLFHFTSLHSHPVEMHRPPLPYPPCMLVPLRRITHNIVVTLRLDHCIASHHPYTSSIHPEFIIATPACHARSHTSHIISVFVPATTASVCPPSPHFRRTICRKARWKGEGAAFWGGFGGEEEEGGRGCAREARP